MIKHWHERIPRPFDILHIKLFVSHLEMFWIDTVLLCYDVVDCFDPKKKVK